MTQAKARKGDLILVKKISSISYSVAAVAEARDAGRALPTASADFWFGIVASATRDGLVKTWTRINWGETLDMTGHAEKIGNCGHWTLPAKVVDVTAVLTAAQAHHWPGHPGQPQAFASYDEAVETTRAHRTDGGDETCPMSLPTPAAVIVAQDVLNTARTLAAIADSRYRRAIAAGRPGGDEAGECQAANIAVRRAELALALADGTSEPSRFKITWVSADDGDTWDIINWGASGTFYGESPDDHACRIAVEGGLADSERMMTPAPWRVQVFSDPYATEPDGEWTNLSAPCAPGEHTAGRHPIGSGPHREDGSVVLHVRCANCLHACWCVRPYRTSGEVPDSPWVLQGEPIPGPLPGGIALAVECIKPKHYGMQINNGVGQWHTLLDVSPINGKGQCLVTIERRQAVPLASTLTVQLRPAPIVHAGEAFAGGRLMRWVAGTLCNAADSDGVGDTSRWEVMGGGVNLKIRKWDVDTAQQWAAAELAAHDHRPVIGWVHHRDAYGDLWRPLHADDAGPGSDSHHPDPDPDLAAAAADR